MALPNKTMAQAATQQIYAGWALFGMKSSRDRLPDTTEPFAGPRPVPRAMRSQTTVQMPHSLHRLRSSLNTMSRCIAHQLSETNTGRPQNMPRRRGFGSPSIQRHPRKSASVSAPLLPPTTSSQMRRALLLGTSVATFASRASLGSSIRACSQQLGRRDDNDIAGR